MRSRLRARDGGPLTGGGGDHPVGRNRQLERHEGRASLRAGVEGRVLVEGAPPIEERAANLDPGGLQCGVPSAGGATGVRGPIHHGGHTGADQRLRTRRRLAVVVAGFERDVGRGPLHVIPDRVERGDLCVRAPEPGVPALGQHLTVTDQNAPDHGIGVDRSPTAPSQVYRPLQPVEVVRGGLGHQKVRRTARVPKRVAEAGSKSPRYPSAPSKPRAQPSSADV